ncbi:hypothetical protein AB6A40_008626 [Gnathostoma spinigerum]|uniref:Uncharacterized protein n=1 Tax=Gnathostoma spinigerum TaxID=75299 RepID=A0ABD6EYY9_9BILA
MTAFLLSPRTLKVKVLNGKAITCNRMTTLFREYFRALQSATSPNPANILDANLHMRYTDSMNNAKLAYSRGMDRACSGPSVMSAKRLYETHIKNGILAINTFERTPKLGSTTIRSNYLARLQDDLNHELEKYKKLNEAKKTRGCASAMIRCGDSFFLGISLGAATSVSIGGVIWMLQAGAATVGIVAIPISVTTILAIWTYVYFKPRVLDCIRNKNSQRKLQCKYAVINEN